MLDVECVVMRAEIRALHSSRTETSNGAALFNQ